MNVLFSNSNFKYSKFSINSKTCVLNLGSGNASMCAIPNNNSMLYHCIH